MVKKGKIDPNLEGNAPIDNAVDVFKYRGKKYNRDAREYNRTIPATEKDYVHACRFPKKELIKTVDTYYDMDYAGETDYASEILSSRNSSLKSFKEKYCTSEASQLKEPDMVCSMDNFGEVECRFLKESDPETQAEFGSKYSWVSPLEGKGADMLMEPWKSLKYPIKTGMKPKEYVDELLDAMTTNGFICKKDVVLDADKWTCILEDGFETDVQEVNVRKDERPSLRVNKKNTFDIPEPPSDMHFTFTYGNTRKDEILKSLPPWYQYENPIINITHRDKFITFRIDGTEKPTLEDILKKYPYFEC